MERPDKKTIYNTMNFFCPFMLNFRSHFPKKSLTSPFQEKLSLFIYRIQRHLISITGRLPNLSVDWFFVYVTNVSPDGFATKKC